MKTKLSILIIGTLFYSCGNELPAENPEGIGNLEKINAKSIYDGKPTNLIKTLISKKSLSNTYRKNNQICEDIEEKQEMTFDNFSRTSSGVHLIWPGNLLQGNSIKTGQLATIPIGNTGRNPIEVKVDAFSANPTVPSFQTIQNPTAGKVQSALSEILDSYYTSSTAFPANYNIDIQRSFSSKQLQMSLNVGYTGPGVDLSASLGVSFNSSKTYYAVTIKQKFFNVSVYPKSGIKGNNGWVHPDYPDSELNQYISPDNPATYVSSVTYGRLYALVYESTESATKVEQALNFAYKNPTASVSVQQKLEYQSTLQNATVYAKQLGGSASSGLEASIGALAGNFDQIRTFIVQGAEASKTNPGYPIEYTAVNVNSNLPVTIKVEDTVNYQDCKENVYKLIVKNKDFATLPIIFRTENNWTNSTYYLSSGEEVIFSFNENLKKFTYNNSVLKQFDLNNGGSSDDVNFDYPKLKDITYKRSATSVVNCLFKNYDNLNNATAYTIEDYGINGGGAAYLIGTKDLQKNALILEIKRK